MSNEWNNQRTPNLTVVGVTDGLCWSAIVRQVGLKLWVSIHELEPWHMAWITAGRYGYGLTLREIFGLILGRDKVTIIVPPAQTVIHHTVHGGAGRGHV